jgi:dipeptidyl-peptidase 4
MVDHEIVRGERMEAAHSDTLEKVAQFPRAKANTLRFTLGAPRSIKVAGHGKRAFFLRSDGPQNFETSLWMSIFDRENSHKEVLLADPTTLLGEDRETVPAEEQARRERSREGGQGIVDYCVDSAGHRVVFTLGGQLWLTQIEDDGLSGKTRRLKSLNCEQSQADNVILNPRISPDGTRVAYTTGRRLIVVTIGSQGQEDDTQVALSMSQHASLDFKLGLPEFVAGEEMDRYEGFWWSPDSDALLVEAFDASAEPMFYLTDPANPEHPAQARRYPQALTANAQVRLFLLRLSSNGSAKDFYQVDWDRKNFEYLAAVNWQSGHAPLLLVQNREQTVDQILNVRTDTVPTKSDINVVEELDFSSLSELPTVETQVLSTHTNPQWIDIVPGLPAYTPSGQLAEAVIDDDTDTTRLSIDGKLLSAAGCQLREVLDLGEHDVLAVVSSDPRSFDLVCLGYDGSLKMLNACSGVWTGARAGRGIVVSGHTMKDAGVMAWHSVLEQDARQDALVCSGQANVKHGVEASARLTSRAAEPGFKPLVDFVQLGKDRLFSAIVRPSADSPWSHCDQLPVLLKPYGGPGFQQVVFSQSYYWESQWWADQGFIVLTVDGHGTTGRGPSWDRAIFENMAQVTLNDQIAALRALPDVMPEADLSRVAMIGWSYGGFLSALSVLRAPDDIHAACAGAPPTDWTLYDTHYTERYLGMDSDVYRRNSIIEDAQQLRRPLMLIHGFADDNVSVANTLRLSQALMVEGKSHTVLPLTGITHMTNDASVAENLLALQRDFLYQALGIHRNE